MVRHRAYAMEQHAANFLPQLRSEEPSRRITLQPPTGMVGIPLGPAANADPDRTQRVWHHPPPRTSKALGTARKDSAHDDGRSGVTAACSTSRRRSVIWLNRLAGCADNFAHP